MSQRPNRVKLGVNIDHVATLRQARRARFPDPMEAVKVAEGYGADSITVHLREDRRHIQDADVYTIRKRMSTHMNLEMAATDEMVGIALDVKPSDVCLVPEKRTEVTTEGGLDVAQQQDALRGVVATLKNAGIRVSLFIDPDYQQIQAAQAVGATVVELHTGAYADSTGNERAKQLKRIADAAIAAQALGLVVNAGHGLDYHNVGPIAALPQLEELNIGFAIIAHALYVGLGPAVAEMKTLMAKARPL
jgi:pyridoxine 5-phosphate synthase